MFIRKLAVLVLIASCSSCGSDATKTVDVSADRLAEIRAKPYFAGNNAGGFAAAALSNPGNGSSGEVRFIGFGPYLHEMGFTPNMTITTINGVGVADIFATRWQQLRIGNPSGFDAAHYKDLIEYLFVEDRGGKLILDINVNVSATTAAAGDITPGKETWQITIPISDDMAPDTPIHCQFDPDGILFFDSRTGRRIG